MISRTCLLVSDDPDDYLELSEALYEVSGDIVLLNVADPQKALEFLEKKWCVPSHIFFNLEMHGLNCDKFLNAVEQNPQLESSAVIAYGDYSRYGKLKTTRITAFLDSASSYSEVRQFMEKIAGA